MKFHTPTYIIEISAITSPKNFVKAYFESTDGTLFVIIYFVFFGRMVWKKFIEETCFFDFKYHQISIEIYQNLLISSFFNEISYSNLDNRNHCDYVSNFFLKAYIKSTDNSLFVITFFIFFGCMVCKKFNVEVFISNFKTKVTTSQHFFLQSSITFKL